MSTTSANVPAGTTTAGDDSPHTGPESGGTAGGRPAWRAALSGATTVLVLALLALALALAVVPRLLGGAGLTVLTGSMEPAYSPGDVVVVAPQESYAPGDVVAFQPVSDDPTLITHRIVAVQVGGSDGVRYVTRGDANGADDAPVVADQIVGSVRYHVPYVGHLTQAVGEHRGTVVVLVAAGLIGYGAALVGSDLRRRVHRGTP